jgi:hypothetical protein
VRKQNTMGNLSPFDIISGRRVTLVEMRQKTGISEAHHKERLAEGGGIPGIFSNRDGW